MNVVRTPLVSFTTIPSHYLSTMSQICSNIHSRFHHSCIHQVEIRVQISLTKATGQPKQDIWNDRHWVILKGGELGPFAWSFNTILLYRSFCSVKQGGFFFFVYSFAIYFWNTKHPLKLTTESSFYFGESLCKKSFC